MSKVKDALIDAREQYDLALGEMYTALDQLHQSNQEVKKAIPEAQKALDDITRSLTFGQRKYGKYFEDWDEESQE